MGMFDTVIVTCPLCGADNEVQSKAGECNLDQSNKTCSITNKIKLKKELKKATEIYKQLYNREPMKRR